MRQTQQVIRCVYKSIYMSSSPTIMEESAKCIVGTQLCVCVCEPLDAAKVDNEQTGAFVCPWTLIELQLNDL